MEPGKILIIRGGAIGDFILTLPVLAALRENLPQARVEILGYPHIAQLAVAGGLVQAARSIEARALAGFFAARGELDEDLADYFSEFALIISYLYDPDEIFQTNIKKISPAQFIPGPHRPDESLPHHATEVLLKPLERLAIFGTDPLPRLELREKTTEQLSPGRWLAVHPGSGGEKKNWPEANWLALLREITKSTPLNLLVIGGEAEANRLQRLADVIPPERREVAFQKPLVELASLLTQCVGFVGHDSGITHLASAVGLPCIVLWGPSNQNIWKPRHTSNVILHHPNGLSLLEVESVLQQITTLFGA